MSDAIAGGITHHSNLREMAPFLARAEDALAVFTHAVIVYEHC